VFGAWELEIEHRRRPPPPCAACLRPSAAGAARGPPWPYISKSTSWLKEGVPLRSVHRGPMDQVHHRSTAAPAVHQRIDDPDLPKPWVKQTAYRSTGVWSWSFYKKNPDLSNIITIPFHLLKSLHLGPFFISKPLISLEIPPEILDLIFCAIDLWFICIIMFRPLVSCS
jgi:hypothetical protein